MKRQKNYDSGQSITECMVMIVIIAVAAIAILGTFSDRFRVMLGGVICSISQEDAKGLKESIEGARAVRYLDIKEDGVVRGYEHWGTEK